MSLRPGFIELQPPVACRGEGVELWKVETDVVDVEAGYAQCLSPDEQQRADHCRLDANKLRFIAARTVLRQLLGEQLGCPPDQVRLAYGPAGRPEVAWPPTTLSFNVSHSGTIALIALARHRTVAIDLEYLRHDIDPVAVGRVVFCSDELQLLGRCAKPDQTIMFFQLWTAKEAVLKVLGAGFSIEPRDFSVADTLVHGCPVHVPASAAPEGMGTKVRLVNPHVEGPYTATLAIGTARVQAQVAPETTANSTGPLPSG